MADYLADSYALFAHVEDKASYRAYFDEHRAATTAMNLVELGYGLLRRGWPPEGVGRALDTLASVVVEPPTHVAMEAARFRRSMVQAGADCSYVDAWGYATAQWLGVPFLTGDDDFRKVPGVEFVKA